MKKNEMECGRSVFLSDRGFQFVALTPPGLMDPSIAIAASRAGGIGILDLEYALDEEAAAKACARLSAFAGKSCGIKLNGLNQEFVRGLCERLPQGLDVIILNHLGLKNLPLLAKALSKPGRLIIQEVISLEQALTAEKGGADGLILKGAESAGFVGEKTSFILCQQVIGRTKLPVLVQGGVGTHSAAAFYAAGAAGVVLDSQLLLTRESPLSPAVQARIGRMDGSEPRCFNVAGSETSLAAYVKPGRSEANPFEGAEALSGLHEAVAALLKWDEKAESIWLLGQDVAFASRFSRLYGTTGGVLQAMRRGIEEHIGALKQLRPFEKGSPMALSHGTEYPIVQGPMARVSDNADFAEQIASAGALPFVALSSIGAEEIQSILGDMSRKMNGRPWGIGLLGFNDEKLYNEQVEAAMRFSPPFAIIAGGRRQQVSDLEARGVAAYVHVPSAAILDIFLDNGSKRFIFEGNECGGHIGRLSSMVLWDTMVERLLNHKAAEDGPEGFHILLAGGIHDALSAAMAAAVAAPLIKRGFCVGLQMGSAYMLTSEIVESEGIVKQFQDLAVAGSCTRVIETSPGHAIRCLSTPYVKSFDDKKRELKRSGLHGEEMRSRLDGLVRGRLRIASKGLVKKAANGDKKPSLVKLGEEGQLNEGIYMVGQLVALRDSVATMKDLHHRVSAGPTAIIDALEFAGKSGQKASAKPCDIAVVGMSCLLPKAQEVSVYWDNILNKRNAITEVPPDRWSSMVYFDKDTKEKERVYSKWGGFLDDIPFDPLMYGMPPNTLNSIEPLQLLTLEATRKALKDAGYENKEFPRDSTSVIIGTGSGIGDLGQNYIVRAALPMLFEDTPEYAARALPQWTEDSFPGILTNVLSGRVANRFNFGGVNYTVDAACASSLAALHDGIMELETGGSDMVIVGGADATQSAFNYLCFCRTHALSPRGRCQAFDDNSDGTVISEGVAMVVLKRLDDAERDGDRVYAVIKAVAGSSDGKEKSMTAPGQRGQLRALRRAYAQAGFSPATVDLWEAHGTGTAVGDVAEATSAMKLLTENEAEAQGCAIGSVKSMIGHTKGAAGIAALIKTVMSLYHKVLPPTNDVETPNKSIDFHNGPLYINTELRPWVASTGHPRRAGVSAFGFGGTNFHAVLEEYGGDFMESRRPALMDSWHTELFLWAADSREGLLAGLRPVEVLVDGSHTPSLSDLSFTLHEAFKARLASSGGSACRLAVAASSAEELKKRLSIVRDTLEKGLDTLTDPSGIYLNTSINTEEKGRIALLFPGQGSQYPNMLRELSLHFSEVREAMERADAALEKRFSEKLSSYVYPVPSFTADERTLRAKRLTRTDITQSALGAVEYGVFTLLKQMDIPFECVAGHSYGEFAALCVAGVFDENTLYEVSEMRGRMMIEAAKGGDLGTMAAVKAGAEKTREALKGLDSVTIANINSPGQTVISGTGTAVAEAVELLKSKDIFAVSIPVSGGFHSHLVETACDNFAEFLKGVEFSRPSMDVFSNTFAAPYAKTTEEIRSCLSKHMARPVNFVGEIEAMYESGVRVFIEAGPGKVLTSLTRQILKGRPFLALATDNPRGSSLAELLKTLGQLAVSGFEFSMDRLYAGRNLKTIDLDNPEAGSSPALSSTTWLVNGGMARPLTTAAVDKTAYYREAQGSAADSRLKDRSQKAVAPASYPLKDPPLSVPGQEKGIIRVEGGDAGIDSAMLRYQQMMSRFIESQKSVMMAYLQGCGAQELIAEGVGVDSPLADVTAQAVKEPLAGRVRPAETPTETPAPAEATAPVSLSALETAFVKITSERTGYPADMLNLDVDMEAELGIDSIKKVEILNEFSKALSESDGKRLREVSEELSKLKTMRDVIKRSSEVIAVGNPPVEPTATPAPAEAAPMSLSALEASFVKITSERTGYPADMLNLDVDMEAELGIDSIKKVEILNEFSKALSESGGKRLREVSEELSKLKTMRDVIKRSSEVIAVGNPPVEPTATSAPAEASAPMSISALETAFVKITSERTGYPADMLNLDVDMEAELGIDSIKKVEILNEFSKALPESGGKRLREVSEELSKLKTMRDVIKRSSEVISLGGSEDSVAVDSTDSTVPSDEAIVPRLVFVPEITPVQEDAAGFSGKGLFVITDDNGGVALSLAEKIRDGGGLAVVVAQGPPSKGADGLTFSTDLTDPVAVSRFLKELRSAFGPISGLIHLLTLRDCLAFKDLDLGAWRRRLREDVKSLFLLSQALAPDLIRSGKDGGAWLTAVTALRSRSNGAVFKANSFIGQAGTGGFIKTMAQEWPHVTCRVVNVDTDNDEDTIAGQIIREFFTGTDGAVEVEYYRDKRLVYKARQAPLGSGPETGVSIRSDWVILITGGGVGITAEVALDLSSRYSPTIILIGRSPMPGEEPVDTSGLEDDVEIKAALIKRLKAAGGKVTPVAVDRAFSRLMKDRELLGNIKKMRGLGATVAYKSVDVRDEQGFGELIDWVYSSYGRIDGFIHGAGVIEDKLLEDKLPESFDRVFDTKADSAFIITQRLELASLKFIVFFSSVSGAFGNRGQADYAAANELVNKLALTIDRECGARVVAINWGPWRKAGMVSAAVERQFNERGIQLISPSSGVRMFEDEIKYGKKGDVEVVIGGGPWVR